METEEQQIESLKKWWGENGRTVVAGLVLGLGGVFGWAYWQKYQQDQSEGASAMYTEIVNAAATDNDAEALKRTQALLEAYPDSGYATLGNLVAARSAAAQGDVDGAGSYLRWIIDNAASEAWRDVARVRLARLLVSQGETDQALTTLAAVGSPGFDSLAAEVRGDALVTDGNTDGARSAYENSLADDEIPTSSRARVQMKLDDLGHQIPAR